MSQILKKIEKNLYELSVLLFGIVYSVYFTVATFTKYNNYYTGRFDLGNMDQTVWNTINGNIFRLTDPNGTREVLRLAFHADFMLILLAPFYLIWEDPRMLLLIQTLVLAAGGFFVYKIAEHVIKNKNIALFFSLCYFLNPAVNYVNLFDFHPVALATTFLLAAFYFILKAKYGWVVLFLILAGICKEEVWLINALLGLYLVFFKKERALGGAITAVSLFMFYILIWVAIPKALGNEHFALDFYSDYGDSPGQIIKNIIFSPAQTISTLLEPDRLDYVKKLFMPLGYLSFIAFPLLIFAGPDLGIDLLSQNGALHQIYYQYSSTITPFIFIAAIYAVALIRKHIPEIPSYAFCIFLIATTLLSAYNYGPLPFAKKPQNQMFISPLENRAFVDKYIDQIPQDLSIAAANNLGSHLSHRRFLYTIPKGVEEADLVMFLLRNSNDGEDKTFVRLKNDPNYQLIAHDGTFYVFKKK